MPCIVLQCLAMTCNALHCLACPTADFSIHSKGIYRLQSPTSPLAVTSKPKPKANIGLARGKNIVLEWPCAEPALQGEGRNGFGRNEEGMVNVGTNGASGAAIGSQRCGWRRCNNIIVCKPGGEVKEHDIRVEPRLTCVCNRMTMRTHALSRPGSNSIPSCCMLRCSRRPEQARPARRAGASCRLGRERTCGTPKKPRRMIAE